MPGRETWLFVLLCLIWGITWIAMKAGINAVPPLMFAGTRFTAAGIVIAAVLWVRGVSFRLDGAELARLALVSVFLIVATYGLLFWGMQYISSGSAAMLELSFTPVALLVFALALRQEAFDAWRASAIVLGVTGLVILFGPKLEIGADPMEAWGAAAAVAAAVAYGLGSVLAKPMITRHGPWTVAAVSMVLGGLILILISLAFEPGAARALRGQWGLVAWLGWFFLVAFGSLIGFTTYLYLLTRWGASKAGSYAFVSPVIAVVAGMIVYDERVTAQDASGMLIMLVAAVIAVWSKAGTAEACEHGTPSAAHAAPGRGSYGRIR